MRFDRLTLEDGLSQSTVLSILQDSQGLMWFGTENGLNSYNGYEFAYYMRERGNPDAISSDFVFDIEEDAAGNLWIATNGGGLAKFERSAGKFRNYRHDPSEPSSISSNVVRRILIDDSGTIWVGTRGAGLDRFDPNRGRFTRYDFGGDSDAKIYALFQDANGIVWAGGDHGLTRLDLAKSEAFTYRHSSTDAGSLSEHSVRTIAEDSDGNLWVGTFGGGLHRLPSGGQSFDRFTSSANDASTLSSDEVTTIFEDSSGRLWVGTTNGLNLMDRNAGTFTRYFHDSLDPWSIGDNDITAMYEDRSGLLWVGTKAHGVNKWNPRTWSYGLEPAKEISDDEERQPNVTSFVEDGKGTLWIGTFGDGLNAMDRDSGETVKYRTDAPHPYRINDDRVMSLMRDSHGNIWIGTMDSGITRLDPSTGRQDTFMHDPSDPGSLSANGIMTMYEDGAGRIWVGTFGGGISRLDQATGKFTRFRADPGDPGALSSDRVTSLAEDKSGRMWVGTESGGLNLFDPASQRFTQFRHDPDDPSTLAADTVYAIHVDTNGTVWVGTHGGGLDRIVGHAGEPGAVRFANVSRRDGLANDVVYGVYADAAGWVWLSTNFGISRYNPDTGEVRNMRRKDGLQSEEFNFGAHYLSDKGELFFGGHNGFNAFQPENVNTSAVAPLIALTGVFNGNDPLKSDLPIDEENGIEISWKDDNISFEFAALDYASPKQNRYMYKLEGFDREWIDLGNRRRVTYTDLDDGQYVLRVRAASAEGVWNEAGLSVPVRVTPAPWDTWWAYLGYAAIASQLVFLLWLAQHRRLRREEQYSHRLEQEVSARTDKLIEKNQQLRDLNKALQESSLSDPLTGLRNRRFVFEEVSRDLELIHRRINDEREGVDSTDMAELVFMMIDLDNFKPINDTYGHAAGDQMLLEFRDVLLGLCTRSEIVIRWGGDEFVVIANQSRPGDIEELVERIRSTVAAHNFTLSDGQVVRTTCSIGFAAYPLFRKQADGSTLDQIISLADSLMYEAKKMRNAWAGMLSPTEAATSSDFDHDVIEPTSLLFRARHTGKLARYGSDYEEGREFHRIGNVG